MVNNGGQVGDILTTEWNVNDGLGGYPGVDVKLTHNQGQDLLKKPTHLLGSVGMPHGDAVNGVPSTEQRYRVGASSPTNMEP